MKFDNSFEVSLPPPEAWTVLMDVERIAPCMPGASLTEVVDDGSFKGTVSVRLGPVALTFEGEARFNHIDEAAQTASVKAQGKDPKGRGGADATVTFRLEPSEIGSKVLIETDLTLSGSVAQYGRGVAQGIGQALFEWNVKDPDSGQLLSGSFMDCALPRADDLPAFSTEILEVPCANTPTGVKSVGEAGTTGAPAAVGS